MNHPALFAALDRPDLDGALDLARRLVGAVDGLKLGLEFVTANGPAGVRAMADLGLPIFLDLKFHDIPNTVAGAVRSAAGLGVAMLTLHVAGGLAMMRAAAEAARDAERQPLLLGVTVLTSLDDDDLAAAGVTSGTAEQALRLADLAGRAGLGGVVCSPAELSLLRPQVDPGFRLIVPGIRPAGASNDDQKRVMTASEAAAAGADVLVVGRPITGSPDPAAAARAIRAAAGGRGR